MLHWPYSARPEDLRLQMRKQCPCCQALQPSGACAGPAWPPFPLSGTGRCFCQSGWNIPYWAMNSFSCADSCPVLRCRFEKLFPELPDTFLKWHICRQCQTSHQESDLSSPFPSQDRVSCGRRRWRNPRHTGNTHWRCHSWHCTGPPGLMMNQDRISAAQFSDSWRPRSTASCRWQHPVSG